jgi:hypothetical protein
MSIRKHKRLVRATTQSTQRCNYYIDASGLFVQGNWVSVLDWIGKEQPGDYTVVPARAI